MSTNPAALSHLRHELRTPLNHIIGYSEMLLEDAADGTAAGLEPGLRTVRENAQLLLSLINEFLGQARLEAGRVDIALLSSEASAPLDAIRKALDGLKAQAREHGTEGTQEDLERIPSISPIREGIFSSGP